MATTKRRSSATCNRSPWRKGGGVHLRMPLPNASPIPNAPPPPTTRCALGHRAVLDSAFFRSVRQRFSRRKEKTGPLEENLGGKNRFFRRWENDCACSPPKNRYDTGVKTGGLVGNLRHFARICNRLFRIEIESEFIVRKKLRKDFD